MPAHKTSMLSSTSWLISSCFPNCMECILYAVSVLQDAAHWLMDQDNLERSEAGWYARQEQLQRDAEQAARQEKASRKQLLDKYHLQAVPMSMHTDVHTRSVQPPKSKVLPLCHHHDRFRALLAVNHVIQMVMCRMLGAGTCASPHSKVTCA